MARNYTPGLTAFYEATLGEGIKLRLEAQYLLTDGGHRDRVVYSGSRASGIVESTEVRRRVDGHAYRLIFSGAF